jgi:hypothetical protein
MDFTFDMYTSLIMAFQSRKYDFTCFKVYTIHSNDISERKRVVLYNDIDLCTLIVFRTAQLKYVLEIKDK